MTRVSVPEIIGRRDELAALHGMRSGGLALISGDAGVGKSRLVEAFLDEAAATVLSGGCLQFETDVPYAPFAEALPGLFDNLQDRAAGYRRMADAVVAAGDPVVLVVEDLHWADASTRDLLLYLSRALARTAVLLIVTCRTDEFTPGHPVAALLAELARAPRAERLHLAPLDRAEVATLAGVVLGAPPADHLVDTLMDRAEGNPFFTEELLAAGDTVPHNVHEIISARLARLSEGARHLARLASVAGRTVPHDLLVGLEPGPSLGAALRELVDHGQLVTVDPDSYTFRHALIHESLYRDLLPGERRSAHARVANWLAEHPSARSAAGAAAELARHWAAAADPVRALASSVRAAEAAEAGLAPAEAHAHYERALEFWPAVPSPGLARDSLLERAAEAASLAGHNQRAVELTTTRLSELDRTADPVRAALAHEQLSYQARSAGNWGLARKASQEATRLQPPDSPARLRLESWLMMLDMLSAHHLDAVRRAERLLPAASSSSGDRMPLNRALTALGTGSVMIGHIDAGVEFLQRHHEFAHGSGTPRFVGVCYVNMSESLIWADRQEEALALARVGVERAAEYGFDIYLLPIVGNVVRALAELQRWDEAVDTAGDPDDPAADPFNWVFVDLPRADVLIKRGELSAAGELISRIGAVLDGQDDVQYGTELADLRARLAACSGQVADARAAVHDGLRVALSGQDLWLVARLVATGVTHEMAHGDPAAADALLTAGREHRDTLVAQGVRPLPRTLRAWRLAEAERTPSPEAWAEVASHAGVDRHQAAYARYREAESLLTGKGSRRRAAEALATASATAAELGAAPLADRVARLASRARLATGPTTPFADLTARELEILTLVGRGLTNAEIAATLFISTKTASVHVSNILRKLGLKSRIQAASLAHRQLPTD